MVEEDDPSSLSWLRGFPSSFACAHITSTLTQDGGAVRHCFDSDPDTTDTNKNNNNEAMANFEATQRNEQLLRKLGDEQTLMKSTLVAFRRWASDATHALRALTARAESAERQAAAHQAEVLRLQAVIAKQAKEYRRSTRRKRSRQDADVEPEEEGSSGEDSRRDTTNQRINSRCESGKKAQKA